MGKLELDDPIQINTGMGNDERARELEYYADWDALELFLDGLDSE